MKKIAKKVAMLLVLVMIASSFTGCFTTWAATGYPPDLSLDSGIGGIGVLILGILILPVDLTVAGVILIVKAGIKAARNKRGKAMDGIDTFSMQMSSLSEAERDSMMQTLDSLPDAHIASLTEAFDSLPEAEFDSFAETIKSFTEAEFSAMVAAFNNLSEDEIIASMERLNSMPEESLIAMLNNLIRN